MNLKEISELINIRNYLYSLEYPRLEKSQVKELDSIKLLIDKKIANMILSDSFKSYVNFDQAEQITKEAARLNNLKSSIINK